MSGIRKFSIFIFRIFAAVNIVVIVAMCAMGYAGMVSPEKHPSYEVLTLFFPIPLVINLVFLVFWLFVRRRYMWIPILGLLLCLPVIRSYCPLNIPQKAPEGSLKIMSYNVCYFTMDKETIVTPGKLAKYIVEENADVVCLQEYKENKCDSLRKRHLAFVYPYSEILNEPRKERIAIYSKYPILKKEVIHVDTSTNTTGAFYLDIDGDTLIVINSHLESTKLTEGEKDEIDDFVKRKRGSIDEQPIAEKLKSSAAKRARQAQIVSDYIRNHQNSSIIFCGDINDTPISYTHHVLTKHLSDCYTRTGIGPGFSHRSKGIYVRIDNILCSDDIEPFECKINTNIEYSDHYPIICSLKKRQKPQK